MGLFSRKKDRAPSPPVRREIVPLPLSALKLQSVEYWAKVFLTEVGMEPSEVDCLERQYPTAVPAPNPQHIFEAGDPPNPWTLAMACAEQSVFDALHVYIYRAGEFMPKDIASEMYLQDGLDILVGIIVAREEPSYMASIPNVINDKIMSSFHAVFSGMLSHYLRDFWPNRESFYVRVQPANG